MGKERDKEVHTWPSPKRLVDRQLTTRQVVPTIIYQRRRRRRLLRLGMPLALGTLPSPSRQTSHADDGYESTSSNDSGDTIRVSASSASSSGRGRVRSSSPIHLGSFSDGDDEPVSPLLGSTRLWDSDSLRRRRRRDLAGFSWSRRVRRQWFRFTRHPLVPTQPITIVCGIFHTFVNYTRSPYPSYLLSFYSPSSLSSSLSFSYISSTPTRKPFHGVLTVLSSSPFLPRTFSSTSLYPPVCFWVYSLWILALSGACSSARRLQATTAVALMTAHRAPSSVSFWASHGGIGSVGSNLKLKVSSVQITVTP